MSTKKQYLTYRGAIRCLISQGDKLIFGTVHEEGQETGVYFAEPMKGKLDHVAGPGMVALARDEETLYAAGTDRKLYRGSLKRQELEAIGKAFEQEIVALAPVTSDLLAVASGASVFIVSRSDASLHQTLELEEPVSTITADKSGEWLVVGSVRGTMSVFDREKKPEFKLSSSKKIHEGAITSLLFENDELRVLSTAMDQKLLVTHARGELEPEDRGGKGMHNKAITAMVQGIGKGPDDPASRFYTTSLDSSIKAWPAGRTNRLPTTQKDGVVRSHHLAILQSKESAFVATACADETIRIYALDEEGKVGEVQAILHDAMAWARHVLDSGEPTKRQDVLTSLFNFQDRVSLQLLAERIGADSDHKLQVYATELLGKSTHSEARVLLEQQLRSSVEDVRHAAYVGLREQYGRDSLYPLEKALDTQQKNIAVPAVKALGGLAHKDDRALEMLIATMNRQPQAARYEAFKELERHYGSRNAESSLLALQSTHSDIVASAIIRFYQLKHLEEDRVQAALRRQLESSNEKARRYAFWVNLMRSPKLVEILRSRDSEANRQVFELETSGMGEDKKKEGPPKLKAKEVKGLRDEDYAPLFEAMASRQLDTCLRGAMGLAALQDTRAFGTLLQLSREQQSSARVQVAEALEKLGDLRSLNRLRMMIRDSDAAVRDAAFSALAKLEKDEPLAAARAGLTAEHEDILQRGLEVLARILRKKSPEQAAFDLLARTLNDPTASVRSEAFKVCLNKDVFASPEDALRFANESVYDDVREKILIELTAQYQEDWAWNMLLEFMNDSSQRLRKEAFQTALAKAKKERRQQSLSTALESRYMDVRRLAVQELLNRRLEDVEDLLMQVLEDEEKELRRIAVDALITARARHLLLQAMTSDKQDDVRVRAAGALARYGDERALAPLTELVKKQEPDASNDQGDHKRWLELVQQALEGLAELGDPGARDAIVPHIESKHAPIRKAAVRALVWSSRQDALGTLREVIKHQDKAVQQEAALGLAYWGDALGASMIFSTANVEDKLLASLGLFEDNSEHLYAFLDSGDTSFRRRVFLILMLLELSEGDDVPDKCLAAMSSAHPDIRLRAAHGIAQFVEPEAFEAFVLQNLNTQVDVNRNNPFSLDRGLMQDLSRALALGSTPIRIRAGRLAEALFTRGEEGFKQEWATFTERFESELEALRQKQADLQAAKSEASASSASSFSRAWAYLRDLAGKGSSGKNAFEDALRQLAFGAYIGLSREPAGSDIRLGAIRGLSALCEQDESFAPESRRVLLLGLGDSSQEVRELSIKTLQALEMPVKQLAAEALMTGYSDMGAAGLVLLAEQVSPEEGEALLKDTMLTKTDGLEFEALKLLQARHDDISVWRQALGAASSKLRTSSSHELFSQWATEPEARRAVAEVAISSRYEDVRLQAAERLAYLNDVSDETRRAAFGVLVQDKLQKSDGYAQSSAADALVTLDPERAAPILLDRIEVGENAASANVRALIQAAGKTRQRAIIDRLYGYIEQDRERRASFDAALMISGHDQYIEDYEDKRPEDREWMKTQQPRHDDILKHLLVLAYRVVDTRAMKALLQPAQWSLSGAVDEVFPMILTMSDEEVQKRVMEAASWRARHRDSGVALLRDALSTGSPMVQFLAAEGLALAGHKDGMSVLMTAVNFMDSYDDRRRAIIALGELADAGALELLLSIAQDEENYLRPAAAEALGHLAHSERSDQIFKLLVGFTQSWDSDLSKNALEGLRHFNTPEAWRVIRSYVSDDSWWKREKVAELLGEYNDPANIELLRQIFLLEEEDDSDVLQAAAESLRKLYGAESLEPDYLLVQANQLWLDAAEESISRLCERGEVDRILSLLSKLDSSDREVEEEAVKPLVNALLSRTPLPVAEVAEKLADDNILTSLTAIKILGRASQQEARPFTAQIKEAMHTTHAQWVERYASQQANASRHRASFLEVDRRYVLLCWACGQLETCFDELVQVIELPDVPESIDVKQAALLSLAMPWSGKKGVTYITKLVTHPNATLRALASAALQELDKSQAKKLLDQSLEDAVTFSRLMKSVDPSEKPVQSLLRDNAESIHLQGVVIGYLAEQEDEEGLLDLLQNKKLTDETRQGAIDGLAIIASQQAIDALANLGKDEDEDEDLRKAAWRARRRAIRSQNKEVSA